MSISKKIVAIVFLIAVSVLSFKMGFLGYVILFVFIYFLLKGVAMIFKKTSSLIFKK